jgi:hypothetical protein
MVNDTAADRGVKLMTDFCKHISPAILNNEQHFYIHGVEKHRQHYKDFDRKTLNK